MINNNNFQQLVIVCRNYQINFKQFINPIYVGVETGTLALLTQKLPISFIAGDHDTLSNQVYQTIKMQAQLLNLEIITFKQDKDYLDSELAIIKAIDRKIKFHQIVIIADGERWDMLMAHINIMKKYQQYQPILVSENNYCFALVANETYTFTNWQLEYRYISIFPLNNEAVIYNFSGCKYYPKVDVIVSKFGTQAISNEFLKTNQDENPKIIIKKGHCLVFLAKTDNKKSPC